jgi:threonylcarbamoyladenosine tRNA methylthiotransferase MtaB
MPGFKIITLGCKVNQCESEALSQQLKASGWHLTHEADAGLCIINTCTVTGKASMQSRQAVRQAIRTYPDSKIVVTGCYAQTEPHEIEKIEGISHIIGNCDKHTIPEIINTSPDDPFSGPSLCHTDIRHQKRFKDFPVEGFENRTRSFLKIQDGCDAFCTYCIVPYARGHSRSMLPEKVLELIEKNRQAGHREIVLTGIHLGGYGADLSPKIDLFTLLKKIDSANIMDRVRMSSIEPRELNNNIIALVAGSKILCNHFHIPFQSGDDQILKRMHRPYTSKFLVELVNGIRKALPDAAIGVDILVGFPGESEEAFKNTCTLIENLPVSYLHVFPFSPRKGTPASEYPDQIPVNVLKERCRMLRKLGHLKKKRFYESFIGQTQKVLVEGKRIKATGLLKGVSSNYVPVFMDGDEALIGSFVNVTIESVNKDALVYGTIVTGL